MGQGSQGGRQFQLPRLTPPATQRPSRDGAASVAPAIAKQDLHSQVESQQEERTMPGQKKTRAAGMKKKPIRLMYRQIDPIHDHDKRMMGATTRRRYASWPRAYRAMLKFAEEYPNFEWWLQEDLVRRGPHSWSQMCADCEKWGVTPVADEPGVARCVRCGAEAPEQARPTRTEPVCRGADATE